MTSDLYAPLKKHFGYTSFWPLQEAIIGDVLAGRDALALLPTGGGKSLCYQLPALLRPGLTIVVSPLIALMKDQVDGLQAIDIPATFLNSSLSADEARDRMRGLDAGHYKLLYVAPERLLMDGFLLCLERWNVTAAAIDEAHCISEWGHDFRPEYRQIARLREWFPHLPILALTATATQRVADDIVKSLRLRGARRHVGSFNRPNLTYRVEEKGDPYGQLLRFLRARKRESGIVYGLSRKTADSLASLLTNDGIKAVPYHAGMEAAERNRSQEAFLRDDVQVVCATIAFGMGVNKPNVRFVVHYDLPKHIEGYYQETGRAGRDGLPSQCLLLFSAGDKMKLMRFIDDTPDEQERARQREKLNEMVHFAESGGCRRAALLAYFGEAWPHGNCKSCDNCLTPRELYDGTLLAQKFMSCVYRIRQKCGHGFGLNHVVDVLLGAATQNVVNRGHTELSTYGIGKDVAKQEWKFIGRELIRQGMLRETVEKFAVIELTTVGMMTLTRRTPVMLTKPPKVEAIESAGSPATLLCDETLFESLRELRKQLADARGVPAYVIFSDVTLRQMARLYPLSPGDMLRVSGVGEKKQADFGAAFLDVIRQHVAAHGKARFNVDSPSRRGDRQRRMNATAHETVQLFQAGRSVAQIAAARGLTVGTIYGHLERAVQAGETIDVSRLANPQQLALIRAALAEFGSENLAGALEKLGPEYDYGLLKVVRAVTN